MATFKILGKNNKDLSLYADADTAIFPNNVKSNSGQQLTISSDTGTLVVGSDLEISSGKGVLSAGGAGYLDLSLASGIFKTSTGAVTIGPGAISISGNSIIQTGVTLSTTGSGNINLPNNGSARFNIESVAVSANVTSANLGTLTSGSSSDASSLHTHSNINSVAIVLTGQTLFSTPVSGEVGYVSNNNTIARAQANAQSTLSAVGAYAGTANSILIDGNISLLFEASLTLTAGDRVYLSATVAGRVTNVAPSSAGQYEYELGILLDASGYNSGAGSSQSCIWQPKMPILIS